MDGRRRPRPGSLGRRDGTSGLAEQEREADGLPGCLVAGLVGLAVGLSFALPVLGPGVTDWAGAYLGQDDVDLWGTQWFYWLAGRRVLSGEPFAHTELLFHPWGKDVYLHTGGNVIDAVLALPFRFLLGPILGYNAFVIGLLLTNGICASLLARELDAPPWAAGLLGALFAFDPFLLAELEGGRPTQVLLAFLLLFWRDWLRLRRGPSWGVALRAALWMALTGLCYWFYAIFSGLAAVIAGLWLLARSEAPRRLLPQLLAAGILSLALALPLAWPMISALGEEVVPGVLAMESWGREGWSPVTREGWEIGIQIWDPLSRTTGFVVLDGAELVYVPGLLATPLVLGLAGLAGLVWGRGSARGAVAAVLGVGVLVATGPALGGTGPVDLAYLGLAELLPPLRRLWWPARALALVQVATLAGAALLFARLAASRPLALGLGLVVFLGTWAEVRSSGPVPLSVAPASVPEVYACLARAEEGGLIELPLGEEPARLHYQAVHNLPLFGGMVEDNPVFTPRAHLRFRERNPWLVELDARARGQGRQGRGPEAAVLEEAFEEVGALGFRYVLQDWELLTRLRESQRDPLGVSRRQRRARLDLQELLGPPVHDDGRQAVYMPWGGDLDCGEGP